MSCTTVIYRWPPCQRINDGSPVWHQWLTSPSDRVLTRYTEQNRCFGHSDAARVNERVINSAGEDIVEKEDIKLWGIRTRYTRQTIENALRHHTCKLHTQNDNKLHHQIIGIDTAGLWSNCSNYSPDFQTPSIFKYSKSTNFCGA